MYCVCVRVSGARLQDEVVERIRNLGVGTIVRVLDWRGGEGRGEGQCD